MVVEPHYQRVNHFSTDGKLRAVWGSQGGDVGQLKFPEAVAVDADGAVYVADRGNDRVQVLRP